MLDAHDIEPHAEALLERIQIEPDSFNRSSLALLLADLSNKLESLHIEAGAAVLIEQIKTEQDTEVLARVGRRIETTCRDWEARYT